MKPGKLSSTQRHCNGERGVAIFLVIFALLLMAALAMTMMLSTSTETGVNTNYRQEEIAYFAARAGVEEMRDRISTAAGVAGPIVPPPAPLGQAGGYVLYLINQGTDATPVQPWSGGNGNGNGNGGNSYMDDELCHDGFTANGNWPQSVPAPGVRCTTLPPGNGWYQTVNSNVQWNGTAAALPYKWVRLAMKVNNSVAYGDPVGVGGLNYYSVDATQPGTQPVCYDGVTQRVLPAAVANCAAWGNLAIPVYATPVYTITAMGVASTGARKVVQAEVGLPPNPPFPYGLFATGNTCNAVTFSGNAFTDSFNSANGGTYAGTKTASGGDVGSFGGMTLSGNASIEGIAGVTGVAPFTASVGKCPGSGITASGGANFQSACAVGTPGYPCPATLPANVTFPTPPAPNPLPPTTNQTYSSSVTLPPGTYGNISVSGKATLTLSPGVYNINSLTASGQSNIVVSPLGQVVLNIAGQGGTAFNFSGQSISNPSNMPSDFLINYAGTGTVSLSGQAGSYLVVNAPNAAVAVSGQGDTFGAVIGKTITYTGQGNFHFDKNSAFRPQNNQNYTMMSFHEISY